MEIFWDVYFVLDGSKCNNNFMKQNCIDTLVGVVIPVSNTDIWDNSTHVDLMKMQKNIEPGVLALIDDYFILDL